MLVAAAMALGAPQAGAATPFGIAAGPARSADARAAGDLSRFVAPGADIRLDVETTSGSLATLERLGASAAPKLGIVQADAYTTLLERADRGDAEAARIMRPMRVIVPLYRQELYLVVRADAPLNTFADLRGARINVGPPGSGTALTLDTLFRLAFDEPLAASNALQLPTEGALVRLVTDRSVDVVAFIDGQPAQLLADMKPASRRFIRLLPFDPPPAARERISQRYTRATIRAASYPNLLDDDLPALAVQTYLVANDIELRRTPAEAVRFARELCRELPQLQAAGHPKWAEVRLALPELGPGAFYQELAARELQACAEDAASAPSAAGCTPQQRALGFCK